MSPNWEELAQTLDQLIAADDNWESPMDGPAAGDKISRPLKSKMGYKAEYTLNCTPSELTEVVTDVTRRGEWDTFCAQIETLQKEPQVIYYCTHAQFMASAREEVMWVGSVDRNNATYVLGTSCTDEKYPVKGKGVKMSTKVAGHVIFPDTAGCRVIQVLDTDPGGMLPGSITRRVATEKVPKMIQNLRRIVDGKSGSNE
ncbi:hypothetical protein PSACC_01863 [Paramicrosporidium saccamoebae]|uniref:START domain-containing protein n=1 Tax=Paramicrosporidium saccamoebae TaxID=1246581 RepID=A0A2H9TKR3_9FUNG|nr:hypothetical protein PSACC_01863 [Paramicrosporidium saccamoebae]